MIERCLICLLMLAATARADELPFRMDGYLINIPLTAEHNGKTWSGECVLDTAATQFWISKDIATALGLPFPDGVRFPAWYLESMRVGDSVWTWGTTYGWDTLRGDTCLVGLDRFAKRYVTFDFNTKMIHTYDDPAEYWHAQWNACRVGLCQWWDNYLGYCPWGER